MTLSGIYCRNEGMATKICNQYHIFFGGFQPMGIPCATDLLILLPVGWLSRYSPSAFPAHQKMDCPPPSKRSGFAGRPNRPTQRRRRRGADPTPRPPAPWPPAAPAPTPRPWPRAGAPPAPPEGCGTSNMEIGGFPWHQPREGKTCRCSVI